MPKLTLTDREKVNLELYINFLAHNSNPCDSCGWRRRTECLGCSRGNAYHKKLEKYDVADLLNYEEIKEYVDSSVKLVNYRLQVESLKTDIRNLEKKISEITDSIDIKDTEKKIDDVTESHCNNYKTTDVHNLKKKIGEIMDSIDDTIEFHCNNCKMNFVVPDDKCKIAFDGEGRLEANVRKYYICPKCTKICWDND